MYGSAGINNKLLFLSLPKIHDSICNGTIADLRTNFTCFYGNSLYPQRGILTVIV